MMLMLSQLIAVTVVALWYRGDIRVLWLGSVGDCLRMLMVWPALSCCTWDDMVGT